MVSTLAVGESVSVARAEPEREPEGEPLDEAHTEADALIRGVTLGEPVTVPLAHAPVERDGVSDADGLPLALVQPLGVSDAAPEREPAALAVEQSEGLPLTEPKMLAEALDEALGAPLGEDGPERVAGAAVADTIDDTDAAPGDGEGERLSVPLVERTPDADAEPHALALCEPPAPPADGEPLGLKEPLRVPDTDELPVALASCGDGEPEPLTVTLTMSEPLTVAVAQPLGVTVAAPGDGDGEPLSVPLAEPAPEVVEERHALALGVPGSPDGEPLALEVMQMLGAGEFDGVKEAVAQALELPPPEPETELVTVSTGEAEPPPGESVPLALPHGLGEPLTAAEAVTAPAGEPDADAQAELWTLREASADSVPVEQGEGDTVTDTVGTAAEPDTLAVGVGGATVAETV